MKNTKKICIFSIITTIIWVVANSAQAKMVYAITDHDNSALKGYDIHGDELETQLSWDYTTPDRLVKYSVHPGNG